MHIALKYTLLQLVITGEKPYTVLSHFVLLNYLTFFILFITTRFEIIENILVLAIYLNKCVICMLLAHGSREWNSIY